jgi:hypothetical protein
MPVGQKTLAGGFDGLSASPRRAKFLHRSL